MKLEPRHARPLQLLQQAEAAIPGCWERLDQMRERRGRGLPDWPTWCYLPIAAGMSVARDGAPIEEMDFRARNRAATMAAPLVGLAAWRVTQGVWDYDPDLYRELWDTPIEGRLPVELLYRLPEWCPYLCLRDVEWMPGIPLAGVFASLEWDANGGPPELRLLLDLDTPAGLEGMPSLPLHLDADTVDECLQRAADEAVRQAAPHRPLLEMAQLRATYSAHTDLARHLLSLVLYLCSQEPDLTRRLPPSPSSYRKPCPHPPQQPTVWPVGLRIGAALRAAAAQRAEPGERLELRWVAPVAVGAGDPVTVVRPVDRGMQRVE